MDVAAPLVADEQSFELMEPGEGALDDPAVAAEAGAVLGLAAGDLRDDAAGRPTLPRTGGTRSTSAISWVTSWRLPPVSVQASGIPFPSTRR